MARQIIPRQITQMSRPAPQIQLNPIQLQKPQVPVDQIIQVLGQNPVASGIKTGAGVLAQAMQRRNELRQQAAQAQAVGSALGVQMPGINTPEAALGVGKVLAEKQMAEIKAQGKTKETAEQLLRKQQSIRAFEKQFGYQPGELGDDFESAKSKVQADLAEKRMQTQSEILGNRQDKTIDQALKRQQLGSETVKREGLVKGVSNSVSTAKGLLTGGVLSELKGIKFTPGKIYSQMASPNAKKLYRHLYNAIGNELYLKTGATANPQEIEGRMIMYMPAANDNVSEMNDRLDMLKNEAGYFSTNQGGVPSQVSQGKKQTVGRFNIEVEP